MENLDYYGRNDFEIKTQKGKGKVNKMNREKLYENFVSCYAEGYYEQYMNNNPVMNDRIVVYSKDNFYTQSSLTPIDNYEYAICTIQPELLGYSDTEVFDDLLESEIIESLIEVVKLIIPENEFLDFFDNEIN